MFLHGSGWAVTNIISLKAWLLNQIRGKDIMRLNTNKYLSRLYLVFLLTTLFPVQAFSYSLQNDSGKESGALTNNFKKNIIFIRHGTTDWSWKMMGQGDKDLPLNKEGIFHISHVSKSLVKRKNLTPISIIASPLLRCRKSAEIIQATYQSLRGKKIPILIIEDIQGPKYYGVLSKEDKKSVSHLIREIEKKGLDDFESRKLMLSGLEKLFPPNKREYTQDFGKRVLNAINKIATDYNGDVIIVSHGSTSEEYLKQINKHKDINKEYWKGLNRDPLCMNLDGSKTGVQVLEINK